MRKKIEREPDLIEFKVNYTLDGDLPVEKYFSSYNSTDALKAFAQSCVKYLAVKQISDLEMRCFTSAFANPEEQYLEQPAPIPLPDPIPELDQSELDSLEIEFTEEPITEVETTSLAGNDGNQGIEGAAQEVVEEIDIFAPPVTKSEKVDPRLEHAELEAEYSANVSNIQIENQKNLEEYKNLILKTNLRIKEILQRINILEVSEYFKWSDKWTDVPLPTYSSLVQ
jgi:hypothetical protein